jgi:hypothetical protein
VPLALFKQQVNEGSKIIGRYWTLGRYDAVVIQEGKDLERWNQGIQFLDEWTIFDDHEKKLGWMNLFSFSKKLRKAQWIVHYKITVVHNLHLCYSTERGIVMIVYQSKKTG